MFFLLCLRVTQRLSISMGCSLHGSIESRGVTPTIARGSGRNLITGFVLEEFYYVLADHAWCIKKPMQQRDSHHSSDNQTSY